MKLARKKSKNEALKKGFKKGINIPAFRKRGISAFPTNEKMIQRKPHCAWGGGCPRCQELEEAVQPKLKINEPNDINMK